MQVSVIVKKPNEVQTEQIIESGLKSLQGLVGGMIEMPSMCDGVDMVCNEEGKLIGLVPNLIMPYDILVGTIVFIGVDYETGESRSLTGAEKIKVNAFIKETVL